ncbi:gamma carbonic anhydrase family protein [bacterium]|nr:gamma carbonic anhydrase family protein [bacterium]
MILPFKNINPNIGKDVFLAPQSVVIGDVEIGEGSSVWFNTVIRGDVNTIRIGKKTNIQDLTMVHVTNADAPKPANTVIGDYVTIGHRVIVHGCTVKDRSLIGMGAILLDNAVIEEDCIIGAGSLVTSGTVIPAGSMAFGNPAKVVRKLTDIEKAMLIVSAEHYYELSKKY